MRIKEFVNTELRDFINYDNKRNIPNLIDGLKWTQRKVLYAFINHIGKNKIVCDKGGMRAADLTHYAHGATSMIDVLLKMAQNYPGSNNLPLFDALGQFGNRLDHDASSPRYISTKLNDNYKKLFDQDDEHILIKQSIEGDEVEPLYYLPKLPLLLINGSRGTGNGFSANVLAYNPENVRDAVKECLKHGYVKNSLVPWIKGYTGTITKDSSTGQVAYKGKLEVKNSTTIIITELPPNVQLKDYEAVLRKLIDSKLIKDYDNESKEAYWRFVINCPRTTTELSMDILLDKFKLISKDTETLAAWVPNGNDMTIRIFDGVEDLIAIWCEHRLEWYEKRRLNLIDRYTAELDWLKTKKRFIEWWNESAADLVKKKKAELIVAMDKITTDPEYINRLLSLRISSLGIDEIAELDYEIEGSQEMVDHYMSTDKKSMMSTELKHLKF